MTADNVYQGVSRLSQSLEELRAKCAADPGDAPEILSNALENLHADIEDLFAADQRRAEEALQQSWAYNRSLIEASLDPLVTIGPDGKITDVNAATETVTGYRFEELVGTDFSSYFTEPDKARIGYQKVFKEGYVRDYPLEIQHRDGHITPVLYNASVYRNDQGQVAGVFAAARDITALKQSSQYARSLIECSLDPLVTISADGKITDVNEATVNVTGVPREQLIGTDFSDYFTEPEKARAGYMQVFEKTFVKDYPLTIRHTNGRLTDVLYNASIYKDLQGNVLGVFAAARDITKRRRAEIELEKYRRNLEDLVIERTSELKDANTQLQAEIIERKRYENALQEQQEELEAQAEELRAQAEELRINNEELGRQIEERKQAEKALKESEARLRLALDSADSGMWEWDLSTNRNIWSDELWRLYGLMPNSCEPSYDSWRSTIHPDDREMAESTVKKAAQNGTEINFEYRVLDDGGEVRWFMCRGRPSFDTSGRPLRYLGIVVDITERKKVEEALKLTQASVDLAADDILWASPEGKVLYVNEAACRSLGYSLNELQRMHIWDFDPLYTEEMWLEHWLEIKDRGSFTFETLHRAKDGRVFPVEISVSYVPSGGKEFIFAYIKDITERKQAEERIAYLASFPEVNPNPIFEVSLDGVVSYANPATDRLLPDLKAQSTDHPILLGFDEIVDDIKDDNAFLRRDVKFNDTFYQQLIFCVPNQRVLRFYNLDITERKQMEEALRNSERLYRAIGESIDYGVWVCAADGRNIYASESFLKLVGQTQEQCSNFGWGDVLHPDDAERTIEAWKECVRTGGFWDIEHRFRGVDGKWHDILARGVPVRNERGEIICWAGINLDISRLKHAEKELKSAHDELELRIQERTAELSDAKENLEVINEELQVEISEHEKTEKELMAAKEAAEAAVEAKAAFLANMSHELRTPLNAVLGFSSLLLEDNLTKDQKEYIERIRTGGEALLALISDILEFSKAEKEKVKLELQPLSLKRSIEESMGMVAPQANDKGLNLAYTIAYGTPDTIICDPGRLRQILVNLLSNAVKFTDFGDISVSVSSKILEGNKRQFQFTVKDTGIGMPQDKMDRLFKPFAQLEYVISRKRDGAGLGLSICKKLVELMGGEIWAESDEGIGSTFRFTIQAETLPGKQLDLGKTDKATEYENLAAQKPLSILVAEDNPSNQRVLVEMLKRLGYRADSVADGCEVLQALQIRPYDLIFMDIRMPEMDGLTATKEIRKLWPDNGPMVVAITAFAMDGDREKCLEAGADEYIAKPVKVDDLAKLLRNITPPSRIKSRK